MDRLKNGFFEEIGIPKTILTDNGTQFSVDRWQQFANEHGFEVRRTTLCNLQSNPVKRVMRKLDRILRTYASHRHHTWSRILNSAEVINDTTHSSTGFIPRELNDGEVGFLTLDLTLNPLIEAEMS